MAAEKTDIVISLSGRDKGKAFLVVGTQGDCLLLCDGKTRRIEKPKRKKRKHTAFASHTSAARYFQDGKMPSNAEIRRALVEYGAVDYSERGRN